MAESTLLEKLEGIQHKFDEVSTLITDPSVIAAAALAITLWDISNTAMTILNVLERMRMAAAVLNIHLKKIQ